MKSVDRRSFLALGCALALGACGSSETSETTSAETETSKTDATEGAQEATGPIVNVNLYPVEEADLMYSLYTFFNDEQIRIKEGMDVTEEYFNTSISRSYRNDPSQILLMGEIVSTLSKMEDYLR